MTWPWHRVGQTWQYCYADEPSSGFIVLVVDTFEPGSHTCITLDSTGSWARHQPPGQMTRQYELDAWENDPRWKRLA